MNSLAKHRMYIAGEWVEPRSGQFFESFDPYTGKPWALIARGNAADVDAAAVNNNYAVQAGLDPVRDSIIKETTDGPWVNIIAVREEDKNKPWVATLVKAYQSDSIKQFIAEKFKGAYVAAW